MLGKIVSSYFRHLATIRSGETKIKGHIELERAILYTNIPCYIYQQSNWQANLIFGTDNVGKYKIMLPKKFGGAVVGIKEHYLVDWTDDNSDSHRMIVRSVKNYDSHIEADIEEV